MQCSSDLILFRYRTIHITNRTTHVYRKHRIHKWLVVPWCFDILLLRYALLFAKLCRTIEISVEKKILLHSTIFATFLLSYKLFNFFIFYMLVSCKINQNNKTQQIYVAQYLTRKALMQSIKGRRQKNLIQICT
jgi:hypothetical protein